MCESRTSCCDMSLVFDEDQVALACSRVLKVVVPDGLDIEVSDAARMPIEVFLFVDGDV